MTSPSSAREEELRRALREAADVMQRVAQHLPAGLALTVLGDAERARSVVDKEEQ